jgi:hypothetical protein
MSRREVRFTLNGYDYIAHLYPNGALRVFNDNGSGDGVETFSMRVHMAARDALAVRA